jgi:hypothetical protein
MLYRSIKPLIVDAVQIEEPTDVRIENGIVHTEQGDWLIRDPQGNVIRCDDSTFKSTYDKLSGWQGLESLTKPNPAAAEAILSVKCARSNSTTTRRAGAEPES